MAKDREKKIAHDYYVFQHKNAKEIARIVAVSEKTVGKWINESNEAWKKERDAYLNGTNKREEDIQKVLSNLTERRIQLAGESQEAVNNGDTNLRDSLDKQAATISLEVSYWNKALQNIRKESKVSLEIYLEVMQQVFNALRAHDEKLFNSTIDFQEQHIHSVSKTIG